MNFQAEAGMTHVHVGDECVFRVAEPAGPALVLQPGEAAVEEEAGPADVSRRVVLEPDLGMEDVAQRVGGVERDERVAVADHDAARHASVS